MRGSLWETQIHLWREFSRTFSSESLFSQVRFLPKMRCSSWTSLEVAEITTLSRLTGGQLYRRKSFPDQAQVLKLQTLGSVQQERPCNVPELRLRDKADIIWIDANDC